MNTKHTMDLTSGPVTKLLLTFTFPLIVSNLLQQLYNAADVIVIGQFAGKVSLAAVGSTTSATNMMLNLFLGLSMGANVVCANLRGAKNQDALDRCMHTAVVMAAVCGTALAVVGVLTSRTILKWMSTPDNVLEPATLYMQIFSVGYPVSLIYNFGAGILRAYGDTRRPMIILFISGVINIVLNLTFVIAFRMDVAGVALATIISQLASAVAVLGILFHPRGEYRLQVRKLRFHKKAVLQITRVGIPCGLNGLVFSASNIVIQSTVNTFGDTAMAAATAANSISTFVYQVLNAFYNANVSFSGQCYGAKKYRRIGKLLKSSVVWCAAMIAGLAVLATVFPRQLIELYNRDPEVVDAAVARLLIICWGYIFYTVSELCLGCLRGIGKSVVPTILNAVAICVPRIVWCLMIVPLKREIWFVYLCFPLSWVISATAMAVYFFLCYRKLLKSADLVEDAPAPQLAYMEGAENLAVE